MQEIKSFFMKMMLVRWNFCTFKKNITNILIMFDFRMYMQNSNFDIMFSSRGQQQF